MTAPIATDPRVASPLGRARPQPELHEVLPERLRSRLGDHGLPLPAPNELMRVALVGQDTYFLQCALEPPTAWAQVQFEDFRSGADELKLIERLRAFDPHVTIVFRPELVPAGLFEDLRGLTIGWLTEPLPRTGAGEGAHEDQLRRLDYLRATDARNFDRFVSFDPFVVEAASEIVPVWRSVALPVADSIYVERIESDPHCRPLFTGRSTPYRERMLERSKHRFDLLHIVHGTTLGELKEALATTTIGLNIHNEPYPSFENRVPVYLAAGRLLIADELSPTHGLEPGIDYIEVENPWEVERSIWGVQQFPEAFDAMRLRGRLKAELFRASRIYPRLVGNALHDVAVFGSPRR